MGPRLNDPSVVNKMNLITPLDTAKTVCNGDGRPSLGRAVQCVLNYTFSITVKCRCRFVKLDCLEDFEG